jgi:hypothetical protein
MSRTTFKQADVERAIKSAKATGLKVETVEVVTPGGTIIRVSGEKKCNVNPWDEVFSDEDPKARSRVDR